LPGPPVPQKAELLRPFAWFSSINTRTCTSKGLEFRRKAVEVHIQVEDDHFLAMKLLNCEELLDHTGLHLFTINKSTLVSVVFCPLATIIVLSMYIYNAVTMVRKYHRKGWGENVNAGTLPPSSDDMC
jgi:hypothetical protein